MEKYWKKQKPGQPLFPDTVWEKPERKVGKIALIGGNKNGFSAVTAAYQTAQKMGVAQVKVVLPDALKSRIPSGILDINFAESNPSGGLARGALDQLRAATDFADNTILIGDSGANAETAALFEEFLCAETENDITITRDAVDLLVNASEAILAQPNVHWVLSLSQFQKITRAVYYPRVVTFSQGAEQIAETLHKFSLTYPAMITLWHDEQIFFTRNGAVYSQDFKQPMRVWSGEVVVRGAVWRTWQPDPAKAILASWTEL